MFSLKTFIFLLGIISFVNAQANIRYSVISLLNNTHTIGVVVDNVTYPLVPDAETSVIHRGLAPIAKNWYRYVKIKKASDDVVSESFTRSPVQTDTVNEFFNRSLNKYDLPQLPTVYQPIESLHRIESKLHIDGQIPTIHLMGDPKEIKIMHTTNRLTNYTVITNMTYIGLDEHFNFENVKVSLAGRGSRNAPKLSYNIKLPKHSSIYSYRHIKLRGLGSDPSYIREQLAYGAFKSMGLAGTDFSFVRVFLNNKEMGIYGLVEVFKKLWIRNVFANGNHDYKHGNLYQGMNRTPKSLAVNASSDLSYDESIEVYQKGQYKIKQAAKKQEMNFEPLQRFTKFIHEAPTTSDDAVEQWNKVLDTESFLRSMVLEILLGFSDNYLATRNNYYLYDEPTTGKFVFIPSDTDTTQGNTFFPLDEMWSGNYSSFHNFEYRPLMVKILQVPAFKQRFEDMLIHVTQQLTNPVKLNDRINALYDMLKVDVEWDRSLPRAGVMAKSKFDPTKTYPTKDESPPELTEAEKFRLKLNNNMNMYVFRDYQDRVRSQWYISLQDAINGPTNRISLSGVKEWYKRISENTLDFYDVRRWHYKLT